MYRGENRILFIFAVVYFCYLIKSSLHDYYYFYYIRRTDNANNTSTVDNRRNKKTMIMEFKELEQIMRNNIHENNKYS